MWILLVSAAFVGLVHSLAPGHWLPVVLMTKSRRWTPGTAALGALTAAAGHILISVLIAMITLAVGAQFLASQEETIERYSGLGLTAFGLLYAFWSYRRHSSCHGHGHHGPDAPEPKSGRSAFLFLFTLGFSPCIAALPVFAAAGPHGRLAVALCVVFFAIGVIVALVGATLLVSLGIMKLDHPILEHYGDVFTGLGVALLGAVLFFI